MTIPLGVEGCIVNSAHVGHAVRVEDDREKTGGFVVYEWWTGSNGPNDDGSFDSWVENEGSLESFFAESNWAVKWMS